MNQIVIRIFEKLIVSLIRGGGRIGFGFNLILAKKISTNSAFMEFK